MKFADIEHRGSVVGLVRHAVILPANHKVRSESRGHLPFILEIGHIERTAELMATPGIGIGDSVEVRVLESRVCGAAVVRKRKGIASGQPLIKPNPANLQACLECISAVYES